MKTNQKPAWRRAGPMAARISHWFCLASAIFFFGPGLRAQTSAPPTDVSSPAVVATVCNPEAHDCATQNAGADAAADSNAPSSTASPHSQDDWVNRWLRRVDKTRAEQPHHVAPLITTHVLLVQQFRFDSFYQQAPGGIWTSEYGGAKGLEIIPNTRMEVQVGIPPYFFHQAPNLPDGFGDISMFLKFRAFSAPEGKGGYFIGFFLGGSFPSASAPNGMAHTVWSPMIAASKVWGSFDVQTTLSGSLPQSGTNVIGRLILFNNTFQFKVAKRFWPELETNSTFFVDGPHSGNQQTFLTPGLIIGPFQISQRLHFGLGFGVQVAATHFHQYDHRWIWTMRFPF